MVSRRVGVGCGCQVAQAVGLGRALAQSQSSCAAYPGSPVTPTGPGAFFQQRQRRSGRKLAGSLQIGEVSPMCQLGAVPRSVAVEK
jgi:hypothetical protein